jgi:Na+/phosphate symporter
MQYFTKKHPEKRRFGRQGEFRTLQDYQSWESVDSSPEGLYIALTRGASEYLRKIIDKKLEVRRSKKILRRIHFKRSQVS